MHSSKGQTSWHCLEVQWNPLFWLYNEIFHKYFSWASQKTFFFLISNLTGKSPFEILWLKINPIRRDRNILFKKKKFRAIISFFKWNLHVISFSIWLQPITWHLPLLNPTSILCAICCSVHSKEQPDNPDDNWHCRHHWPRESYPTTWTSELQEFLFPSKDGLINGK